jgi:MFS family permease
MPTINAPSVTRKPGVLISRNFALLWVGQSISFIGDALLDFTLALWIAFDLGRGQSWAPLAVSGVILSSAVGTLVIGPIAGVFVDRWDKRRTMLRVIALQAVLTALLLTIADLVPLPFFPGGRSPLEVKLVAVYAIVFIVYGCAQFTIPARTALIGDLVAEEDRPQASSLFETVANLALLIGSGIAPVLFIPFGIGVALIADALSFVVAFVAILGVKAPPAARSTQRGARSNVGTEFMNGLRFSLGNVVIRTMLVVYALELFGSGAISALLIFFLTQNLHTPQAAIGLFPVVLGAGLVLGSVLGGALARRVGLIRIFWISIFLTGLASIGLSRQVALLPGLVFGFVLGVPNGIMNVALTPLVLLVTPRTMVGRVMTVLEPTMTIAQIASLAIFGTLASTTFSHFHARVLGLTFGTYDTLVLIPGLLCLLAGAFAFANLRNIAPINVQITRKLDEAPETIELPSHR